MPDESPSDADGRVTSWESHPLHTHHFRPTLVHLRPICSPFIRSPQTQFLSRCIQVVIPSGNPITAPEGLELYLILGPWSAYGLLVVQYGAGFKLLLSVVQSNGQSRLHKYTEAVQDAQGFLASACRACRGGRWKPSDGSTSNKRRREGIASCSLLPFLGLACLDCWPLARPVSRPK